MEWEDKCVPREAEHCLPHTQAQVQAHKIIVVQLVVEVLVAEDSQVGRNPRELFRVLLFPPSGHSGVCQRARSAGIRSGSV
jgi:hypothetical protein